MKIANRIWSRVILTAALCLSFRAAVWGAPSKLSPEVQSSGTPQSVDVTVTCHQSPTGLDNQKITAAGGLIQSKFQHGGGGLYTVSSAALPALAANPNLAYITPERQGKAYLDEAPVAIRADLAYQFSVDGTGGGVAVINTGIAGYRRASSYTEPSTDITYAEQYDSFTNVVWGCNVVCGSNVVWGSITVSSGVKRANVVWGSEGVPYSESTLHLTGGDR